MLVQTIFLNVTRLTTYYRRGAWNRVLDPIASMGERAMGYLVTNAMKAKRKLGGRISKKKSVTPSYSKYPVLLNKEEQQMIFHSKKPLTLKLDYTRFLRTKASVMENTFLPVTSYQLKKIKSALHNKTAVEIKPSLKQIGYICGKDKIGGFLPALVGAIPAIAAVGSLISSAVNTYNKKANDKLVSERIPHNTAMEGSKGEGVGKKKHTKRKKKGGENKLELINKPRVLGNGLFDQLMKKEKRKKKKVAP